MAKFVSKLFWLDLRDDSAFLLSWELGVPTAQRIACPSANQSNLYANFIAVTQPNSSPRISPPTQNFTAFGLEINLINTNQFENKEAEGVLSSQFQLFFLIKYKAFAKLAPEKACRTSAPLV
jgi:hypothetical protein